MNVTIIGVPYDLDQPSVGMGRAPDALLRAGLAQRLGASGCHVTSIELIEIPASDETAEMRLGRLMAKLGQGVAGSRAAGCFPLIVGGDCLVALGVLAGLPASLSTGIAWIDAHGDFNTPETTISGYLGGMPLACAVGRGLDGLRERSGLSIPVAEHNVALLGARDLDPLEEHALGDSAVMRVREADLAGETAPLEHALGALGALAQVYLHVDIDVLDPAEAPGVDYPAAGGLALPQLCTLVRRVAQQKNIAALALTAINPEKDIGDRTLRAALDVISAAIEPLT